MAAKHDIWDMWGSKGAEHVKINGSGLTSAWFSSNCKSIIHFYWNLSFSYSIDRGLKHFGKDFFGKHFRGLGHYFPPVFASSGGGGVGGGAKTRLVRWPAVYHVLSGATGSIEPVSTQLYFLHPVGGAPENLISGHFDRNWVAADNSIICWLYFNNISIIFQLNFNNISIKFQ